MHATQVLQKCLGSALEGMHALRQRVLFKAVEATVRGRRLVLMDVARSWPGAVRVRAPLKALDRLLSNRHLQVEVEPLYAAMGAWLLRAAQPVIVIDWSDLKADGSWHLLRAAVPVGGRTLTLLEMVFPAGQQGTPKAERTFLKHLHAIVPKGVRPILVTDAGFRAPWFRAVAKMGWFWVGRLRHRTLVKPVQDDEWVPCRSLYVLKQFVLHDLGVLQTVRAKPWLSRVVVYGKPAQGRRQLNAQGKRARCKKSLQCAAREREPWLLVASPDLSLTAQQLVRVYARRMQIEQSFRDLKSHRHGNAFEDSLTRKGPRIAVLLLLNALAAFASWLVGMAAAAAGLDQNLMPFRTSRRLYSLVRLGREALVHGWPCGRLSQLLDRLRNPAEPLLQQLGVPA